MATTKRPTVAQLAEQVAKQGEALNTIVGLLASQQEGSAPSPKGKGTRKASAAKLPERADIAPWVGLNEAATIGVTMSSKTTFVTVAKPREAGSRDPKVVDLRKDGKPTVHGVAVKAAMPLDDAESVVENFAAFKAATEAAREAHDKRAGLSS
jgi:hypothetical protein